MRFEDIATGQALPALAIPITVPLIAGGAIATRDYFPGHHDLEAARAFGSPHIFMNSPPVPWCNASSRSGLVPAPSSSR